MSQEQSTLTTRKYRRNRRHQPTLVNPANLEGSSSDADTLTADPVTTESVAATGSLGENAPITENLSHEVATSSTVTAQRSMRLPRFFSKVEKDEPGAPKEDELMKARLARANRGKGEVRSTESKSGSKAAAGETKALRPTTKAATAERPRLFKTRHFIGMALYLFGAEFLLPLEITVSRSLGIEQNLVPTFKAFGLPIQITTSFVLNILTLVGFLFLLVKLDLLPNTTTARRAGEQRRNQQRNGSSAGSSTPRPAPPTMKQGVQGEDDDLYKAYRSRQRREKKS